MSNVESAKSGLMEERPQRMPTPTISINPASKFKDPIARSNGKRTKKKNIPHQHSPKFSAENENRNIFSHILKKRLELDTTTTSYRFDDTIEKEDNCMSRLIKLTFSTPGLVAMVIIYSVMGATIFPLIEAPKNISKTTLIAKSREECLKELWTITEKLNILYESNWTLLVHEQLRRFEGTVVAATRHSAASLFLSTDISENALSQFDSVLTTVDNEYPMTWSFSEALLYSVTVITTIGHGSLTPRTAGGKIATILYAFIGVPLMLMCLSSLGTLLADCLRRTYSRLFCHHHREYNDASGEKVIGHRQKNHLDVEKEPNDDRADVFKKQEYINCDGAQDDKYRINCKICKYNADSCFTRPHNCKKRIQIINATAATETQLKEDYFKYSQLTINKLPVSSFQETTEHCLQKQPNNTSISSTQSSLATSLNNSLISSTSSVPAAITQHKLLSISNKKQQHHLQQHLQNTPYNFEVTADNNNIENSVNDTTISTTQTATVYVPIIATGTNMTQPIMKYQTIQVPLCKPYGFTSYVTNRYEEIQLPQPTPTCEIAVGSPHDMRRAKFLTKPFPKEINISLHNNDIICQKDLVQQHKNFSVPSSTSTIMSRTDNIQTPLMGDDDNGLMDSIEFDRSDTNNATKFESVSTAIWAPTSATTTISNSNNICTSFALLLNAGTQNDVTDHTNSISVQNTSPLAYVDQFDDGRLVNALSVGNDCEDETEHHLSCTQGTPSRIPLIPSASITNDSKPIRASPRMSPTPTHGFNNVKKAFNFQRSSLNAFHDSNGKFTIQQQQLRRKEHHQHIPKPVIINSKGKCNLHAGRRTSISPSFCYAGDADSSYNSDHIDTSDDEEDSKELHALEFLQPDLRRIPHFEFDNGSLESLRSTTGNHKIQHYQVPFIIVILILIFYVCLGTMVFALWENWSLIDGAYFCFVTLTTIGYSGLMPERTLHGPELQLIVCCVYLLLGLVLVAMSLNILETQLIWKCKRLAARLKSAQD